VSPWSVRQRASAQRPSVKSGAARSRSSACSPVRRASPRATAASRPGSRGERFSCCGGGAGGGGGEKVEDIAGEGTRKGEKKARDTRHKAQGTRHEAQGAPLTAFPPVVHDAARFREDPLPTSPIFDGGGAFRPVPSPYASCLVPYASCFPHALGWNFWCTDFSRLLSTWV